MIRPGTLDDVEALALLMNAVYPEWVQTVEGRRHSLARAAEQREARWFAAVEDGELVGWGAAGRETETSESVAYVGVVVHPDARRHGLGAALYEQAEEHARSLRVDRMAASSREDEQARRFALAHGWRCTGEQRFSSVDPRSVALPEPPEGVRLRPLSAFDDDPTPIYELDVAASADIPLDFPLDNIPYQDWLSTYWAHPDLDRDVGVVAVVDDRPVALSMLRVDRASGRGMNDITGTLREYRGRGLATLVKRDALRRAAEAGITLVVTENDETNAPMLRVNERLGYRPLSARLSWLKDLS